MDIQKEYEHVKDFLNDAEHLGNISPETRKKIQEEFWLLFTFIAGEQQKPDSAINNTIYEVRTKKYIDDGSISLEKFYKKKEEAEQLVASLNQLLPNRYFVKEIILEDV